MRSREKLGWNAEIRLTALLKKVHAQSHTGQSNEFPLSVPDLERMPSDPKGLEVVQQRRDERKNYRKKLLAALKENPDISSDQVEATEIFQCIAPILDDIFFIQMQHVNEPVPRPWVKDAPQEVQRLQQCITKMLHEHAAYFLNNPENKQILELLRDQVPIKKTQAQLMKLVKRLEKLTMLAGKHSSAVFGMFMSDYYTFPNNPLLTVSLFEADMRLIFPDKGKKKKVFDEFVKAGYSRLFELFKRVDNGNIIFEKKANVLFGICVDGCGAQLFSLTSGEGGFGPNIMVLSSNIKTHRIMKDIWEHADLDGGTEEQRMWYWNIFVILHELSHVFNDLDGRLSDEIVADLSMLISTLFFIITSNEHKPEFAQDADPRRLLASLMGEYVIPPEYLDADVDHLNDTVASYIVSARYLLLELIKHGVIQVHSDGKGFEIADEETLTANIPALLRELWTDFYAIYATNSEEETDVYIKGLHVRLGAFIGELKQFLELFTQVRLAM